MKNYIFLTAEGYTYSPSYEGSEPDIENLQVLGIEKGTNEIDAFKRFNFNNAFLKERGFEEVTCYELSNLNEPKYLNLKNLK